MSNRQIAPIKGWVVVWPSGGICANTFADTEYKSTRVMVRIMEKDWTWLSHDGHRCVRAELRVMRKSIL